MARGECQQLRIESYELRITNCGLRIGDWELGGMKGRNGGWGWAFGGVGLGWGGGRSLDPEEANVLESDLVEPCLA